MTWPNHNMNLNSSRFFYYNIMYYLKAKNYWKQKGTDGKVSSLTNILSLINIYCLEAYFTGQISGSERVLRGYIVRIDL
jgi:hypothetical protein